MGSFNAGNRKARVSLDLKNGLNVVEEQPKIEEATSEITPVKTERKPKEKKVYVKANKSDEGKSLTLRVSKDFKLAIKMYCLDNDTSEKDLIIAVADNLSSVDVSALLSSPYDTDDKGRDVSMRINAFVKDKAMKFLIKTTTQNDVSKGFLVAQAVASEIGFKKTL